MSRYIKSRPIPILGVVVILVLVLSAVIIISDRQTPDSNVTVKYEGNYPWLVQGAFADYTAVNNGEPPWFVTSSGQLLLMAPEKPGTPNNPVNGWIPGTGSSSLNWTIESRTGNNVFLRVLFDNAGCQDNVTAYRIANQSAAPCTYYNFEAKVSLMVNLTNDEAYVNGVDQGLLNFWSVPLLEYATSKSGSVFINQQRYDSAAIVSAPLESSYLLLSNTVNESGTSYTSPVKLYEITPTTFGIPNSFSQIGWLNVSVTAVGSNNVQETTFGPYGYYDFYNGLAYEFSLPQYSIAQTICNYNHGQPSNCELANVSTTLGEFFRSGLGIMVLQSTNIPLTNTQQQSSGSQTNTLLTETAEVTVPLAVIGIATFIIHRKRLGRNIGRSASYKSA